MRTTATGRNQSSTPEPTFTSARSEEHTSELQSRQYLHSFPTRRSSDLAAYALCRPPGHHATATAHGGSCYLNNAAIAAESLRRSGAERIAVIDIDAHHGNGTQSIFYARADVYVGKIGRAHV